MAKKRVKSKKSKSDTGSGTRTGLAKASGGPPDAGIKPGSASAPAAITQAELIAYEAALKALVEQVESFMAIRAGLVMRLWDGADTEPGELAAGLFPNTGSATFSVSRVTSIIRSDMFAWTGSPPRAVRMGISGGDSHRKFIHRFGVNRSRPCITDPDVLDSYPFALLSRWTFI